MHNLPGLRSPRVGLGWLVSPSLRVVRGVLRQYRKVEGQSTGRELRPGPAQRTGCPALGVPGPVWRTAASAEVHRELGAISYSPGVS